MTTQPRQSATLGKNTAAERGRVGRLLHCNRLVPIASTSTPVPFDGKNEDGSSNSFTKNVDGNRARFEPFFDNHARGAVR